MKKSSMTDKNTIPWSYNQGNWYLNFAMEVSKMGIRIV
jgi:hypothetical protein